MSVGFLLLSACARQGLDEPAFEVEAGAAPRVPQRHRATGACATATRSVADDCAPGPHSLDTCGGDGECTAGRNGRCTRIGPSMVCACVYDACDSDEECPVGSACACNPFRVGNRCIATNCSGDRDCGDGGYCGPVDFNCNGSIVTYQCYAPADDCIADSDCPAGQPCAASSSGGPWKCQGPIICR